MLSTIFADAAKYTLTAGVISGILSGKTEILLYILTGATVAIFSTVAYFVAPLDRKENET